MTVTLRKLQYFCALVDMKHFGRAAEKVSISQPALSVQIRELEHSLGVKLVERKARDVLITQIGQEVAIKARAILNDVRDLSDAVRWSSGLSGRLNFGVIPSVAPYLLPIALPLLRSRNITLDLRVREAQTDQLLANLADGKLDAAVLALPVHTENLTSVTLFEDRFLLAGSTERVGTFSSLQPSDVKPGQLLLLDEGHCLADQALEVCALDRSQTRMDLGASSLTTLCGLAAEGFGLTFLPEISLKTELSNGSNLRAKRFASPEPRRTIGLVRRTLSGDDGWFSDLAEMLTQAGKTLTDHARAAYPI